MIASGNQNQFPSSFAPLGDLLKALMFLSNLNSFNSSPYHRTMGSPNGKVLPRRWRKKAQSDLVTFSLSHSFLFMHYLCVLLFCFWVSLVLCYTLFNMFLFVCFQFCFIFVFHKKKKLKNQKNTKTLCILCTLVLVYLGWPLKQSFLNFVSFVT